MRSLSSTLVAAQRRGRGTPAVRLEVHDRPIEYERLRWAEEYTAPSESDTYNAGCVTSDGAILRIRQAGGTIAVHRAYPSGGSLVWSGAWTTLATGKSNSADVAIAADPSSGAAWAFWVAADNATIEVASSSDNGQTWGTPQTVLTLAGTVRALAATVVGGSVRLVYSRDPGGADPDDVIGVIYPAQGGGWEKSERSSYVYTAVSGLGASQDGDSNITILVADGPPYRLTMARFEEATKGWFTEERLLEAGSGSNYQFRWPQVLAGPSLPRTWYVWLEDYTGSQSHRYPMICATPRREQFTNPVPQNTTLAVSYRMSLLLNGSDNRWYFVGTRQAFRASAYTGSASQKVDLSKRVAKVDLADPGDMHPSRLRVWLRNDDGALAAAGQAGEFEALRVGSLFVMGLGYRTTAGDEVSYLPPHWVERLHYVRAKGESWLVIEGEDAWGYLERLRALWQVSFSGTVTVRRVAEYCVSIVSDVLVNFNASPMEAAIGEMTLQPGQDYASALRRALAVVRGCVRFGADQSQPSTPNACRAELLLPDSGDPSSYSYGGAGEHPIVEGRYDQQAQEANHYEVYGSGGIFGQALDWADLKETSKHVVRKLVDGSLTTSAQAQDLASSDLEEGQRSGAAGEVLVPMNVGQEVMDVIALTDANVGLTAAKRRVAGYTLTLDLGRGVSAHRLTLMGA